MEPEEKLGNVKARPIWLVALIPLLGIVWGAWFVAKYIA
ncbi:hypothetical protein L53_09515 [Hyphomonas sp. L-53-1-40]|jgi:hypothetical protein|uniref:Uncharacterized protein n=1 Tax=hydrothermal vent metagenome TaxID=652676 RepID=A0A160TWH8_9ZZZZ|nr:hypothetical protein L53_09515 [Hyphomonas sp. L-53-1-40]|tara:strand:+ start:1990 stop:2106 length:117 start_codon:yes stop_codon:yes gene_type:complete